MVKYPKKKFPTVKLHHLQPAYEKKTDCCEHSITQTVRMYLYIISYIISYIYVYVYIYIYISLFHIDYTCYIPIIYSANPNKWINKTHRGLLYYWICLYLGWYLLWHPWLVNWKLFFVALVFTAKLSYHMVGGRNPAPVENGSLFLDGLQPS